MIILDATTRSLEIDLNAAVATNQLPFVASYVDINQSTFAMSAMSSNTGASNSTTAVTLVAAPGATTSRVLKYLSIKNSDTASVLLWVQMNDNATLREIWKGTLAVGDSLIYTDANGFNVLDSNGAIKESISTLTALTLTSTLTMSGTAANIALGSNYISYAGTDAGFSLSSGNDATISGTLTVNGTGASAILGSITLGGSDTTGNPLVVNSDHASGAYVQWNRSDVAKAYYGAAKQLSGGLSADDWGIDVRGGGIFYILSGGTVVSTQTSTGLTLSGTLTVTGNTVSGSGAGTLRADGGIRIGADSTNNLLDDASTGAGTATLYIGNASINVTSDERVKQGVRLWGGDASAILRDLPVKVWDRYLSDAPMGGYDGGYVGFTAQDMRKVAPWSVNTQGDTGLPWQARYEFLNGIIVKGWQEHDDSIESLLAWKSKAEAALANAGITV